MRNFSEKEMPKFREKFLLKKSETTSVGKSAKFCKIIYGREIIDYDIMKLL